MAELEVRDLCKEFPTPTDPLPILRGVSLDLSNGENAAILGPSGSGKSTLLHILGTLDRPTSGTVRLAGQDPFSFSEAKLADFRNQHIGFIFQDHHLLPQCSALENVLLPVLARGSVTQAHVDRAQELLTQVGVGERMNHRPAELSGGERQRTAVARALILKPTLLLADEPTGNLDRASAGKVAELLLELHSQRVVPLLIVVTHSTELAAKLQKRYEVVDGSLQAAA